MFAARARLRLAAAHPDHRSPLGAVLLDHRSKRAVALNLGDSRALVGRRVRRGRARSARPSADAPDGAAADGAAAGGGGGARRAAVAWRSLAHWRMLLDMVRFNLTAARDVLGAAAAARAAAARRDEGRERDETVGEYLRRKKYSASFARVSAAARASDRSSGQVFASSAPSAASARFVAAANSSERSAGHAGQSFCFCCFLGLFSFFLFFGSSAAARTAATAATSHSPRMLRSAFFGAP